MNNDALQRLIEAATPGPWSVFIDDTGGKWTGWPLSVNCDAIADKMVVRTGGQWPYEWDAKTSQHEACENARLIALAPTLAAEVIALREKVDQLMMAQTDLINDTVQMGMARDEAYAQLSQARAEGYREGIEAAASFVDGDETAFMSKHMMAGAIRALTPPPPQADPVREAARHLADLAASEAGKAMRKFPQPNYVISKVAEEAGEVVKAAIHCAEGRGSEDDVRGEIVQAMAMLIRLYVEGDQVHGLRALSQQEGGE